MDLLTLLTARIAICATILLYSGVIGENTILIRLFTRPLTEYHTRSFWHILKTMTCAVFAIGYDLQLNIPDNITPIACLQVIAIQSVFIAVGYTFLKQSIGRNFVVNQMLKRRTKLKLVDNEILRERTSVLQASVGKRIGF